MKRLSVIICTLISALALQAKTITLADPTIFYEDGIYYLTGTGDVNNGFTMYFSTDLIHWESCGYAAGGRALYKDDTFGTGNFWAPQIIKYGNAYYMAYAANELIAIAKASDPAGPYKQTTKVELPHNTGQIDPFIFIDDDGKKYIYYVRFTGGNMLYVAELTDDLSSIKEETITKCIEASDNTWEHTRHITDTKITEGPTVIKDGEYYYLLYSANHFEDIDYSVGYAYSRSPMGPWTKVSRPFLTRHNTGINGSGHGDLFKAEDGQWYYVFHVHASNTSVSPRRTALVPVTLTDDHHNKFIPEVDRMILLDDNAHEDAVMPEASARFEVDNIFYKPTGNGNDEVQVTYRDAVKFGGYSGNVTIPSTVENDGITYEVSGIGTSAFYKCSSLKGVVMGENIRKIGIGAFEGTPITSVVIPANTTAIQYRAFADCTKLKAVTACRKTATSISASAFSDDTYANGTLYVNTGSKKYYAGATGWKNFANIVEVEDTGIDTAEETTTEHPIYNIAGQRMSTPQRGLYIVNGQKMIIR